MKLELNNNRRPMPAQKGKINIRKHGDSHEDDDSEENDN
jgi:hypothetical protein